MRLVTAFACGGALAASVVTACSALLDTSVLTRGSHGDADGGGAQSNGGSDAPTAGGPDGTGGAATGGDAGAVAVGGNAGLGATGGDETGGSEAQGGTGATGGTPADAGTAGLSDAGAAGAPPCIVTSGADYCDGIDNDCNPATHDVCPAGCMSYVFQGHGYMACTGDPTYTAAEALCVKQHMHLVKIESAAENAFLLTIMKPLGSFVWMGGTDIWKAHTFRWPDTDLIVSDGVVPAGVYTNFGNGEPASLSNTACLQLTDVSAPPPGSWTDTPCTEKQPFICERYAPFPM